MRCQCGVSAARRLVGLKVVGWEDEWVQLAQILRGPGIKRLSRSGLFEFADITGYLSILTLRDERAYAEGLRGVRESRDDLRLLFEIVGNLDVAGCVATLRHESRAPQKAQICLVQLADCDASSTRSLRIDGVVHPSLDSGVANDVELGSQGLLITGLNMSGKSTFLRAVGVNALMAQSLGLAWAQRYGGAPVRVMAAMGASDSLEDGTSFYMAEVGALSAVLEQSKTGLNLLILDELLRGTNSAERVAAVVAILRSLGPKHFVLAATHDIEVTRLLCGPYRNVHFSAHATDLDPLHFDFKLRHGPCPSRNALKILQSAGFPTEILEDAQEILLSAEKQVGVAPVKSN